MKIEPGASNVISTIDDHKISAYQLLIVVLCLVFNMIDGFDITAMAVTAHQIDEEMQLGADRLGLVFSFSLAGMMLGAAFLASLSDIVGRRTIVIASLLLVGLTVLLTAYATSLTGLITLRFLSGLGAGAMLASVATLAAEYSPLKYRALCVTAVTAGYPLGATMTGLVANQLVPEFGWRMMFIFGGATTLALCAIAYLLVPESIHFLCQKQPANALARVNKTLRRLSRDQIGKLPALENSDPSSPDQAQHVLQKARLLLTPDLRRSTLILWASVFLCITTLYFLMSWIPKMIINLGHDEEVANLAFTTHNLGGVIGIFCLGYLASRWRLSSLISAFAVSAGLLMLAFAGAAFVSADQFLLISIISLIGFTLAGGYTGLYAVAAKVYAVEIRSTGVGWAIGLGRFGAVIGPGAAGFMIASGYTITTNFLLFAIPLFVGGALAYRLRVD